MTATEKYLAMNNQFCRLRDAIYNPDVDEADEDENVQKTVEAALGILCQYLDYYKELNDVHTRVKSDQWIAALESKAKQSIYLYTQSQKITILYYLILHLSHDLCVRAVKIYSGHAELVSASMCFIV